MSYDYPNQTPLWPLLPNWKAGVQETLEFRTRIIGPTMTGMRQKRRMRIAPRRSFQFEVHPHHQSRRLLDNIRFAVGKREWWLPIWHDGQVLGEGVLAGDDSVPCVVQTREFREGGYAVLRSNQVYTTEFEIVQIDVLDLDHFTIVGELENDWPAGTRVYPLRLARLANDSNTASLYNGEVSTLSVKMEVSEPCDWVPYQFQDYLFNRHEDYPILDIGTNWADQRNHAFDRIITDVDNDTSLPAYFDFPDKPFIGLDIFRTDKGGKDHDQTRQVLYALAGRYQSVWVPTYTNDLQIVSDVSGGTFSVENCRYHVYVNQAEGRDALRIELWDGSVFYAMVADSEDSGDTEIIYTNLSDDIDKNQVRRISFMTLMQQSSDSITLTHLTDIEGACTTPFVFEGVFDVADRERGGLG